MRKATVGFVMSVCPSVRPHGTTLLPLDILSYNLIFWGFIENPLRELKSHSNLRRPRGSLHKDQYSFMIISCFILLRMINVSDQVCRQKYIYFFLIDVFRKSCRLWDNVKNVVEPDKPRKTIWRMRFACWITKATKTRPEYIILTAFPLQQWVHERAWMLRYTCNACLVDIGYSYIISNYFSLLIFMLVSDMDRPKQLCCGWHVCRPDTFLESFMLEINGP
jgi:hypothetical protein